MKYKRPEIEVEAWQWTGTCYKDAIEFVELYDLDFEPRLGSKDGKSGLIVPNPNIAEDFYMIASTGDYIVLGVIGYRVIEKTEFENSYVRV